MAVHLSLKVVTCREPRNENSEAASMGTKNMATPSEANNENTTATDKSPNICPATPSTNVIGRKTDMVVSVEETIAVTTSVIPFDEASFLDKPDSKCT